VLLAGGSLVLLSGVTLGLYPGLGDSIRAAVFNTVSALSTTGYATVDFGSWNGLGWLVLIALMLMGGGTGSTAGGIKQYRILVLAKGLAWEVRRWFLPRSAVNEPSLWRGERRHFLTDREFRRVSMFALLYLFVLFAGTGILAAHGYPLADSLFEFASSLSTVGVSVGVTSAGAPAGVLWAEMMGMVLGRLEFFAVVVGVVKIVGDLPFLLAVDRGMGGDRD
jgi:trk system potassium uptake protein TrkH